MNKLVLIVDDDPISILVSETIIRKHHFSEEIKSFKSGKDGISYLKELLERGKELPDLIFLDVMMPIMDGWEFLDAYDEIIDKSSFEPNVIMLTALTGDKDREKAKAHPLVRTFVSKPITSEFLRSLAKGDV
ncbi:MAG TPA: response regulator [Cryomorphaceae bacterium]|nr:response regulator [Cryomorphaceae bacterium]